MSNNIDRSFNVKFNNSQNFYSGLKFNKTNNSFNSKARSIDKKIKVGFNSSDNLYSNIKINNTQNSFVPKSDLTPVDEDIYYDEVIYYDGGDVEGYGDD